MWVFMSYRIGFNLLCPHTQQWPSGAKNLGFACKNCFNAVFAVRYSCSSWQIIAYNRVLLAQRKMVKTDNALPVFSSSGPKDAMSLCHGVASVVRPSVLPSVHSFQNASSSSFLNRFWFWLFHKIGLGGGFKTSTQNCEIIIYGNLCKFMRNHQKCFFSFISRPILIVIALFGRAELRTLNFYTEFWNFAPLINYGNLCKFIPKITKIASSPTFLDRFSFCLFYLIGLGGCFKTCTQNFEIH